jgi:tetratricopeptide (TPR) repeat protein
MMSRVHRRSRAFPLVMIVGGLASCSGDGTPGAGAARGLPDRPTAALPEGAQAWSFLGTALFPPPLDAARESLRQEALREAQADRDARPQDPEAWIWVGRQEAYLGLYREAIATFTEGFERFPDDARFLRHRGHRWITLREFAQAVDDLTRAAAMMGEAGAEIEPDGLPNAAGIPLTTLAFNVYYHRALALYLMEDLGRAEAAWRETLAVSDNPDLDVAARYWLHLTLRKRGEDAEAARLIADVHPDAPLLENATYRDLLLHLRGDLTAEEVLARATAGGGGLPAVTALYGLAMGALLSGEAVEGMRTLQAILDRPMEWAAFGAIAAEVEVARAEP